MSTFETEIVLSEVEMILIFTAEKGYPATWGYFGGCPGAPDSWYAEGIIEYGKNVPLDREERLLEYYSDEIEQAMVDCLEEERG